MLNQFNINQPRGLLTRLHAVLNIGPQLLLRQPGLQFVAAGLQF